MLPHTRCAQHVIHYGLRSASFADHRDGRGGRTTKSTAHLNLHATPGGLQILITRAGSAAGLLASLKNGELEL